jgi:hypothetical protein
VRFENWGALHQGDSEFDRAVVVVHTCASLGNAPTLNGKSLFAIASAEFKLLGDVRTPIEYQQRTGKA